MTKKHFGIGVACLYGFGLAVALLIRAGEPLPASTQGWLALLAIPFVWGIGPISLTIIWLAFKRWNLSAAKFGLLVFAGLYLAIVFLHWWWQKLV